MCLDAVVVQRLDDRTRSMRTEQLSGAHVYKLCVPIRGPVSRQILAMPPS